MFDCDAFEAGRRLGRREGFAFGVVVGYHVGREDERDGLPYRLPALAPNTYSLPEPVPLLLPERRERSSYTALERLMRSEPLTLQEPSPVPAYAPHRYLRCNCWRTCTCSCRSID